jgi:hypothetical protein
MKRLVRRLWLLPILAGLLLVLVGVPAHAQSRRFELGSHFTFLNVGERAPGFGGTVTWNLTRRFSLESTLNFFPGDSSTNLGSSIRPVLGAWRTGNILQGQFGIKAVVLRHRKARLFVKAKPGFVSFSNLRYSGSAGLGDFVAPVGRQTSFALDVGGGVELHPSQRTFLRFDIGDTYFRYNSFQQP